MLGASKFTDPSQYLVLLSQGKQIPETSFNFCAEIMSMEQNIKVPQAVISTVTSNDQLLSIVSGHIFLIENNLFKGPSQANRTGLIS